jgi:hypothetical protein
MQKVELKKKAEETCRLKDCLIVPLVFIFLRFLHAILSFFLFVEIYYTAISS